MLELVTSMKQQDVRQLIRVHAESIYTQRGKYNCDTSDNLQQLRAEQDFYDYLTAFFGEYGGIYALWVSEGRYCSALRLEPYNDGYLLSGLETPREARRKGYANALIRSVLQYVAHNGGTKLYSHVDKNNAASLALHESCGFHRILEHAVYVDGSVYHSSCTLCYEP